MTKKEFVLIADALKTFYPKEKDSLLPNQQAMELWFRQLQDIPYQVAEAAVNKWVATNKWSPSIADIREIAAGITCGDVPDWGDGWNQLQAAIRKFGMYRKGDAMASMDEITRKCVERLGFVNLCLSENQNQDRANFRMLYEELVQRKIKDDQIPQALKTLIGSIQCQGKGAMIETSKTE